MLLFLIIFAIINIGLGFAFYRYNKILIGKSQMDIKIDKKVASKIAKIIYILFFVIGTTSLFAGLVLKTMHYI